MKYLLTFSTCLLLMLCSIVSYANLDDNFIYLGEHNNSSYYCSNTSDFTWHEARAAAQAYGGHLAIVDNAAENEFIRSSIMADYVWLGLTDENSEGNYYDVFGNPCQYYNWNTGEPNNIDGQEHYVRLLRSNGNWTDRNETFLAEFVVEIPNAPTPPSPTGTVCTERTANNVVNCNNNLNYGGWLKIAGYTTSYDVSNAHLVEYSDGTAVFTGTWTNHDDSNLAFDFEIWASGKTDVAPANSPKEHNCLNPNYNDFYYYADFDGILYGKNYAEGAQIAISTFGAAFQLGVGANATGTANTFGASAWYSGYLIQQPTNGNSISLSPNADGHLGDINIQLTGGADDCDNPPTCDGEINSIILTNGSESVTLENGGTYQLCELPNDNYLEAVVSGSHESFKFTVNGDDRTENVEPYNYPSVSNSNFWNPQAGSYNVAGKLYSENELGGLLCEELSLQITIETCGPCFDQGGDIDGDGVCAFEDCDDNNPAIPAAPGTACNDNDPTTINDVILADGCDCAGTFDPCAFNGNVTPVDGGNLTFADGSTETSICVDNTPDPLAVNLNNPVGTNQAWVITDADLNILGLPAGPPFDLNGAGVGTCLIWSVSFESIFGAEVGMNASNLEGCFDLSNPLTVVREVCIDPVNIGDKVFFDTNKNGIQDNNEAGVQDVTVLLISAGVDGEFHTDDDVVETADVTDGNGEYGFTAVNPGTYCIEFVPTTIPAGFEFTTQNATNDTNDSDVDEVGKTDPFTIVNGQDDDLTFDAGVSEIFVPSIAIDDVTVNEEDGTAIVKICLDAASDEDVTVDFATADGSALEGDDYAAQNGIVTIEAGELCAMVMIELADDATPEDTEELVVNLSNPTNGELTDDQGTVTILDTDVVFPTINIDDVIVNEEDGTAILKVCLDEVTTVDVSADFSTGNVSAGQGTDYVGSAGTVTIPAGELCAMIMIEILDNENPEDTEEFIVNLLNPVNGELDDAQGTVTILDTDVIVPNISIDDVIVNEEDGTAVLKICLDEATSVDVTVDYATGDDSALQGSDYVAQTGTVTIEAGELCAMVMIELVDDANPEDTEALVVDLSNPTNGELADDQGTINILDTDVVIPGITIDDVVVNEEDGTAVLKICLDEATTVDVSVDFETAEGSAIDGSDYVGQSGAVTIEAGELCTMVMIELVDDANPEATEELVVNLSNPTGAELVDDQGTVTILDTDVIVPNISIDDVIVNEEDGTAVLKICLDEATTVDVTVDYATGDDSAIDGSDYVGQSGSVTIEAGELCAMVMIELVDDEEAEETEELVVNLSNPTNGEIVDEQGTVTILDTDVEICEAIAGTMLADQAEVVYIGGNVVISATPNGDAVIPTGFNQIFVLTQSDDLVIIDAGADPQFAVSELGKYTIHSLVYNPTTLDLSVVQFGTTTGFDVNGLLQQGGGDICASLDVAGAMIFLVEPTELPNISINDIVVNEEDGTATLEICLDAASTEAVTVDYATADGSATEGSDYTGVSGTVTIEAGELCAEVVTIPLVDDATPEDTEELVVNLSNPANAEIADDQGTVTILDTDVAPLPNLDINDITVNEEDGTATLEICLDAASDEAVTVDFATADGSANEGSDYTGISGTVTIEAGELCAEVTIPLVDDATPEDTEVLDVNLSNPTGAVIADDQGTVTILDTDVAPLPNLDINDITVNEEDGTATLEICLDAASDEAVTVDFATADGSANEGSDYTGISGTVTIEAGELCAEVTIPLVDDATPEDTEVLDVNLSNPTGAVIADDQGTVTILDTDEVAPSNCDDITIEELDGTITADGYDAPIVFVKVYDSNWNNVFDSGMITDNAAQTVSGLPAGEYWVFVKTYDMSWNELCDIHETITIEEVAGNDPNLAINDITVNEEDGTATLEICLDEASDEAVTVDFATADDSANEGSDYTGISGTVTIEAGELCAAVTIPLVDDATPEDTEELVVNLSNPTGANLADDQGVVTILDTDVLPGNDPLISISDITLNEEDGLATLAICLDAIADEDVTVDYTTTDGSAIAGEDYVASSGTVTIPAGMLCMIVDIPLLDDTNPESTETLDVVLSNPNGGSIADGTGVVTILDTDVEDGCSAITIDAAGAIISVGGYSDPIVFVKVYDGNWDLVYNSGMLTNNEAQSITITESGTYWVFVKSYDNNWNQLCDKHEVFNIICGDPVDACADFGGDSDGDGVCDDNDLCPGFDDNIDLNGNGIPDGCDTIDPNAEVCIEREVTSTDLCAGDTDYSFFIRFENTHYYYQFTDAATFTEYTDGTALLTGTIQNNEIPELQFEVAVQYFGRTDVAPANSPKEHLCLSVDTDLFYYYPSLSGTLTGIDGAEGAVITMSEFGPAFQVGLGGNVTSSTDDFGGSGWMTMNIVSQPTTGTPLSFEASTDGEGDVNIMLDGGYEECLDVAITAPITNPGTSSCNVEITPGDGTLSIGGYTQPVAIVQVFDNQWTPVFSCMGDCANPLVIDDLSTGTYFVKVSLYDENWNMVCDETEGYYSVVNTFGLETQGAEFLFFTAAKDGNDVVLNWTTNTEYKNDYFVVERSTDGLNFENAFDVSSIRDNDAAVSYTDEDANPLRGKSFYRLKQVFNDGTYRYSNIKPIEFELGLLDVSVYPNPTTDKVFINLVEFEGEAATVVIYNALGEQMMTYSTASLTSEAIEFNVTDFNAGMYSITAKMEGRKQLTKLFVVAKR